MTEKDTDKSNDHQSPIRVMLVDDHPQRAATVEEQLRQEGFCVLSVISSTASLLHQIEQQRPDVVLIDLQSPDRDMLESLAIVNKHSPTAMAMFTENDDPAYIRQAVEAGISTYMTQGLDPARVKPLIDVAIAQFRTFQGLRNKLESTRDQLEERQLVDQAKRLLIKHKRLNEDEAHQMLTRLAMNSNQRLADVTRTVIATLSPPDDRS